MLSRILLILAGLFTGMWIQDGGGTAAGITYPALAFMALMLALAATGPSLYKDVTGRLEQSYREWLDAWQHTRTPSDSERPGAEQRLASCTNAILIGGTDRVIKSLQTAMTQGYTPTAVATLVLDMRRSLRRAGLAVRREDLEMLLSRLPSRAASANGHPSPAPRNVASLLG